MSLRAATGADDLRAAQMMSPRAVFSQLTPGVRVETLVARAFGSDHRLYCLELGGGLTDTDEPTGSYRCG